MGKNKPMILFSGFLGSGKTTLLQESVKYLAEKKIKCAVIVNEAGEIGIDNLQMKKLGYNVWELLGGCICCTLSSNLETTLKELENYDIDVILTEPSGASEPSEIFRSLEHYGYHKKDIINFYLLDALRIGMLTEILEPLLTSSLLAADIIFINKIDLAQDEEIILCEETAKKKNNKAKIIRVTLNENLPAAYTDMLDNFTKERSYDASRHL